MLLIYDIIHFGRKKKSGLRKDKMSRNYPLKQEEQGDCFGVGQSNLGHSPGLGNFKWDNAFSQNPGLF